MKQILHIILGLVVAAAFTAKPVAAQVPDSLTIIDYFPPQLELTISLDSLNALVVYPDSALKAGVEGRVFIRLVAEADGSASEVEVMKGLGYGLGV